MFLDSKLDRKDEVNVVNEARYFTICFTFQQFVSMISAFLLIDVCKHLTVFSIISLLKI